jgi:SAM-dependent methyltransferase
LRRAGDRSDAAVRLTPAVNRSREPLKPVLPHDGLPFEELRRSYNFENVSARGLVLTRLIIDALQDRRVEPPVRAVDIGCGRGIELNPDYQWAIREHVDEYWGIEPDPAIASPQGMFDEYRNASLESADLPERHFDVAYSFMVMEHLADPEAFMRIVHRALKPGGVYLFATPNGRHYFTRIASALRRLRLDEPVLQLTVGRESAEYHYPVQYRFNRTRRIRQAAAKLGFAPPEFAFIEVRGPVEYFPKPLRFVYHGLRAKRRLKRNPESLITMLCQMTKV